MAAVLGLFIAACAADQDRTSNLNDLQLIGVDFELNSIIIENSGARDVVTNELWIYRDGEATQLDIFTLEPRSPVSFSMRELGEISAKSGEIALITAETAEDSNEIIAYVAWGTDGFELAPLAGDAGLWPEGAAIETETDTLVILHTDFTGIGPQAWAASDEIG